VAENVDYSHTDGLSLVEGREANRAFGGGKIHRSGDKIVKLRGFIHIGDLLSIFVEFQSYVGQEAKELGNL
jgi:hypothetical protein